MVKMRSEGAVAGRMSSGLYTGVVALEMKVLETGDRV